MKWLLVRHAEAGSVGDPGVGRDADRPLTAHGRATAERLAHALEARGYFLGALVCSPLVRALQTAEPLKRLLRAPSAPFVVCDALAPDAHRPDVVIGTVAALNASHVALVGHLPDIAALAGRLIGAGGGAVAFDKGTAACFDWYGQPVPGGATLSWLLSPEWY